MKVLFVIPYVPNLVRVRPYNLIRNIAARGYEVTLFTVWSSEQEKADIEHLKTFCHEVHAVQMPVWRSLSNCLTAVPTQTPLQSVYSWEPKLIEHLNGHSPYDVVHVEHLRGSRYGLYLKEHTHLPVVWDSVDCISHLFQQAAQKSKNPVGRLRSRFELGRTRHYEGWLLDKFDHVLVTSPIDKQSLLALKPDEVEAAPITVLQNGVDVDYFHVDPEMKREPATLVISGKMSYHANVSMVMHLAQDIMPHVWKQRPDVKLWIVGKDPTREIQALAEKHTAVTVTGTVPDLRPYLQQATIAVTPITYGAGIQNKVLEAMACGTPVVTTPKAISAIQAVPERDLMVAGDPVNFAETILDLLDEPETQRLMGLAARQYVETHHHWLNIAAHLEKIYHAVASVPVP
ncbi:MAG: glycosyltransferase [Chloroflexi bacterium]|nr:glycosyltransferase [Chloroflexota bacterium]